MTTRTMIRFASIFLSSMVMSLLSGCSKSAVKFDPAPAPRWIGSVPTNVHAQRLYAVGQAPATTNAKRDRDLAIRNAKSQVAQLFESRVASRSSDWSLVMTGGKKKIQRDVFQTSVEVQSNVTIEDVSLASSYRDETSRTQYVYIKVDRVSWCNRIQNRIQKGLFDMQARLDTAGNLHKAGRPLRAFQSLIRASARGRALEPDVLIIDLLESNSQEQRSLQSIKSKVDQLGHTLRDDYRFVLTVRSSDPVATKSVTADIEEFLGGWGFVVTENTEAQRLIRIEIALDQHPVAIEKVAGRSEHVHAGTGSLNLTEPDGSILSELGVRFRSDRFQERHINRKKASQMAIQLAADTLSAKFRSAFRNLYAIE